MALYDWAICSYDDVVDALTDTTVPESERPLIERIINTITDYIENYCNRRIKRRADLITEFPEGFGEKWIILQYPPVDVQSVYIDYSRTFSEDTKIDSDYYFVDEKTGLITLYDLIFPKGVGYTKILYYGGCSEVPNDLKDVAIQMVITVYRRYKTKQIGYASVSGKGMQGTINVIPNQYQREVLDLYRLRIC